MNSAGLSPEPEIRLRPIDAANQYGTSGNIDISSPYDSNSAVWSCLNTSITPSSAPPHGSGKRKTALSGGTLPPRRVQGSPGILSRKR